MLPIIDKQGTANRIRNLMQLYGFKPTDIQIYLDLSCVQTVYRWLEGVNVPTVDNLYAMSQLFGVKMDDMIVGNRRRAGDKPIGKFKCWLLSYHVYAQAVVWGN